MEDRNVYVDFHITMEEGTSIFKANTLCSVYTSELDEAVVVGEATSYLFDPRKSTYEDIYGYAYSLSSSLSKTVSSLGNFCELENLEGFVVVIQSYDMKEEWKFKGLEEAFFQKLLAQFPYLNVELVVYSATVIDGTLFDKFDGTFEQEDGTTILYKHLQLEATPAELQR